jgi:hypothetical protein
MDEKMIRQRVKDYYWRHDLNCATVALKILAEQYSLELSNQVLDSTIGMHGAGNYGAQCGLVEGTLLFLGILGQARGLPDDEISILCCRYAGRFEEHFASLQCCELRPEGFSSEQPPHLREELSSRAVAFGSAFLQEMLAGYQ